MKALGYQLIKGRGIAFMDEKKVKIKGSEVGFSLATIEKILAQNQAMMSQKIFERPVTKQQASEEKPGFKSAENKESMLAILLKSENGMDDVPYELTEEGNRKKRKKGKRIS